MREQRSGEIAGPAVVCVNFRRAQPPSARHVGDREIEGMGGRVVEGQRGRKHDLRSAAPECGESVAQRGDVADRASCEKFEFEMIGRDDRRVGEGAGAEKFGDVLRHVDARADVADDGIADMCGVGAHGADARDGPQRRFTGRR